jgi:hypothetical protein
LNPTLFVDFIFVGLIPVEASTIDEFLCRFFAFPTRFRCGQLFDRKIDEIGRIDVSQQKLHREWFIFLEIETDASGLVDVPRPIVR